LSQNAVNALGSFSPSPDEQPLFIIGPVDGTGFGGDPHLLITTEQVCVVSREGRMGKSHQTHTLFPLGDLHTMSISAKWHFGFHSDSPQISLKFNSLGEIKFWWGSTCHKINNNPPNLVVFFPINIWYHTIATAEARRGGLVGGLGGYPMEIPNSLTMLGGERAVECLFGRIETNETGSQVGGLLLTNGRLIFYRRGTQTTLTMYGSKREWGSGAAIQLADDGGYTEIKSLALNQVNQSSITHDGSVVKLTLDDGESFTPGVFTNDAESRLRGFIERMDQERATYAGTCPNCGASNEVTDLFCMNCGSQLQS